MLVYTSSNKEIDDVILNYKNIQFNTDLLLNDIIKISDTLVCFATTSENKKTFYIIMITIHSSYVVVKYYTIEIFELYHYILYSDIKLQLYDNFSTLGFSYVDENNLYFSGLAILNYANSNDIHLDLSNIDDIDINNIIIDLHSNVKIDNNIFGLIPDKIQIIDLINCEDVNLISLNKLNNITKSDIIYNMEENENIKLEFINHIFYPINCTIKYQYIIKQPGLEIYNSFAGQIDKIIKDEASYYKINTFKGKISYYNIFLGSNNFDDKTEEKEEEEKEKEEEKEEEIEITYTIEKQSEENIGITIINSNR